MGQAPRGQDGCSASEGNSAMIILTATSRTIVVRWPHTASGDTAHLISPRSPRPARGPEAVVAGLGSGTVTSDRAL